MLAIVPRMPTVAATGFTTFLAPLFAMGPDTTAHVRAGGGPERVVRPMDGSADRAYARAAGAAW
jgi:hypothetical protein